MNNFEQLVYMLKNRKLYISAAESCTGGLFSAGIVSVPDASKVLSASFVTYSEEAKINILGVSAETIKTHGVVSEQVALEMAKKTAEISHSQVGVGITGYAGPGYDENDTDVGTVCFGFVFNGKTLSCTKKFGNPGRNVVRELAAQFAAITLVTFINRFADSE